MGFTRAEQALHLGESKTRIQFDAVINLMNPETLNWHTHILNAVTASHFCMP
jgi:hypothetical protein